MKVDKAVCTNDTFDDLSRAIRYEAVFTTLVENKILAIKRECEEHQRIKDGKRSFGNIISGKHIFCIKRNSVTESDFVVPKVGGDGGNGLNDNDGCCSSNVVVGVGKCEEINMCQLSSDIAGKNRLDIYDENIDGNPSLKPHNKVDEKNSIHHQQQQTLVVHKEKSKNKTIVECKKYESDLTHEKCHTTQYVKSPMPTPSSSSSQSQKLSDVNSIISLSENMPQRKTLTTNNKAQLHCDTDSIHPAADGKSDNESVHSDKSRKITFQTDETKEKRQKLHRTRTRQSDESNSSAASSFIEICVSDENMKKSQRDSTDTITYPTSSKNTISAPAAGDTSIFLDHERNRLRLLEAKSISAQCSPIFPRQRTGSQLSCPADDNHYRAAILSSCQSKVLSRRSIVSDESGASVVTFGGSESMAIGAGDKLTKPTHAAAVIALGKCKKIDISSKLENNDKVVSRVKHGFINSFNQLTSNNNLPAVITTTKLRSSNFDTIMLQRMIDGKSSVGAMDIVSSGAANERKNTCDRSDKKEKRDEDMDGTKRNKKCRKCL